MATSKRAWKLQEFVAHGSAVNCLALGHKSGRVMVTGGEDKKVNMWAVGKPNCIMSLAGHTTPVESVRFGVGEDIVAAGSQSGALKIWDLEATKILRTLTGHKASIKVIDFHPYGDFVSSGSLDTNIKLWDMRKKGCIFTYKGHSSCVNCLRFSPDGRWIVSGGEEGAIKIWDLQAGKHLVEFRDHGGPITCVEFHPNELFLATGSADRSVKFWDLESMQCVNTTDTDSTAVRCVAFHPEGSCLYSAYQDVLKVYGWEPARCYDLLSVGWGRIADVAVAQNQLIGVSFSQSNVSVSVVDIQQVQPLGGPPYDAPQSTVAPTAACVPPRRRSYMNDRPMTQCSAQRPKLTSDSSDIVTRGPGSDSGCDPAEKTRGGSMATKRVSVGESGVDIDATATELNELMEYRQVFQPRRQLARGGPTNNSPFQAPPDDANYNPTPVYSAKSTTHRNTPTPMSDNGSTDVTAAMTSSAARRQISPPTSDKRVELKGAQNPAVAWTSKPVTLSRPNTAEVREAAVKDPEPRRRSVKDSKTKPVEYNVLGQKINNFDNDNDEIFEQESAITQVRALNNRVSVGSASGGVDTGVGGVNRKTPSSDIAGNLKDLSIRRGDIREDETSRQPVTDSWAARQAEVLQGAGRRVDSLGGKGSGFEENARKPVAEANSLVNDFLPASIAATDARYESDQIAMILNGHDAMITVLNNRYHNLQIISTMWSAGNVKMAVDKAVSMNDQSLVQDVVNIILRKECVWTLDLAASLMPPLYELITSKYDSFVATGMNAIKIILRNFASLIKETVLSKPSIGVDLSREERYNKCISCYKYLNSVRSEVERRSGCNVGDGQPGGRCDAAMMQNYRELLLLLSQLD